MDLDDRLVHISTIARTYLKVEHARIA